MVFDRIAGKLESMQPQMNIRCRDCYSLVPVEKRMILDQALEKSRGLGDRIVVVAGLWSEDRALEGTEIANSVGATRLINENGVQRQDFDNAQVAGQLLG